MSTPSDSNYYRLQPFIIPTQGKDSIHYNCFVMDLPIPDFINNGVDMLYAHKNSRVTTVEGDTVLQIELSQPDCLISDLNNCKTYKTEIFF